MRFVSLKDDSVDPYIAFPDKKFCLVLIEGGAFALVTLISCRGDDDRISDVYLVFTALFTELEEEENRNLLELFKPKYTPKKRNQYLISVQGRDEVKRNFNYSPVINSTVSVRLNGVKRRGKIMGIKLERKLIIDDQLSLEYEILFPESEEKVWMRGTTIEKLGRNKPKPAPAPKKTPAKKSSAKKTTASKNSASAKKTSSEAEKTTASKQTASKKQTAKKTAAKEETPAVSEEAVSAEKPVQPKKKAAKKTA